MVHRNYDAKDLAYRVHNSDLKQLSAKRVVKHKEVSSVYYLYVWIISSTSQSTIGHKQSY